MAAYSMLIYLYILCVHIPHINASENIPNYSKNNGRCFDKPQSEVL